MCYVVISPQIRLVNRRHCVLYKFIYLLIYLLRLLTYLLIMHCTTDSQLRALYQQTHHHTHNYTQLMLNPIFKNHLLHLLF